MGAFGLLSTNAFFFLKKREKYGHCCLTEKVEEVEILKLLESTKGNAISDN